MEYITYNYKQPRDPWTHREANEVKYVVNANADTLSDVQSSVSSLLPRTAALESGMRVVQQTADAVTVTPNTFNIWGTPLSVLTVALGNGQQGFMAEYALQFTVASDSFTLTLPSSVRWNEEPEWENGYTYQVSILNGLAVYAGWEAPGA